MHGCTSSHHVSPQALGSANASQYEALEASWWEQRDWGITLVVDTLAAAGHPMATKLAREFSKLEPQIPSLQGFVAGRVGETYHCGVGARSTMPSCLRPE